jgi:hypothetical protein
MVGLKRVRSRQDSGDTEVESASSHLQHNHTGVRQQRNLVTQLLTP